MQWNTSTCLDMSDSFRALTSSRTSFSTERLQPLCPNFSAATPYLVRAATVLAALLAPATLYTICLLFSSNDLTADSVLPEATAVARC
jgi:hypothetical protein